MKEKYFFYGVFLLIIGLLVFTFLGFFKVNKGDNMIGDSIKVIDNSVNEEGFKSIETGTTGNGDVSIGLVPKGEKLGLFRVDIFVNTHSVDLSLFDLKEITTLEYSGKTVKPVSAPELSGHHSNGELAFETDKVPDSFTVKIIGIPKVEERVFRW